VNNEKEMVVTLYKEDYTGYGWELICEQLKISDNSNDFNSLEITVSKVKAKA